MITKTKILKDKITFLLNLSSFEREIVNEEG